MGIGTMTREEKAVIYVTSQYLTESPLLPVVDGYEEIHFEVELIRFIQVCGHVQSNGFLLSISLPTSILVQIITLV